MCNGLFIKEIETNNYENYSMMIGYTRGLIVVKIKFDRRTGLWISESAVLHFIEKQIQDEYDTFRKCVLFLEFRDIYTKLRYLVNNGVIIEDVFTNISNMFCKNTDLSCKLI